LSDQLRPSVPPHQPLRPPGFRPWVAGGAA
jgi:hypothetical protein